MNIKNIELEKEYSWKDLCELLDIPYKTGNSKIKQIKEFESLCKYRKNGIKIIIEEIYDAPKKIENKRKEGSRRGIGNKNSISKLMSSAIMYKVTNSNDGYLCAGINNWLFEIGVVRNEFVKKNRAMFNNMTNSFIKTEEQELTEMDKDFITLEYSSLRYHFISALERIRKTKLADYFITCKIGCSQKGTVGWTRELDEDEIKILYKEKDRLYKKYEIMNEYDLLYGNESIGVKRDIYIYNEFRKDLRKVLYDNWKANFEFTAYKVILKNTSDMAFKKIDNDFFEGYSLAFLKSSIYAKRKRSAEKRQEETIKKYKKIDKEGNFFDNTNRIYLENMKISKVDLNKINGIYVELWDYLFKELLD
ncbi:MAG: hypothetical protein RR359_03555 [Bacilli bacterium]